MKILEATPNGEDRRIAIVVAKFNDMITESLLHSAAARLKELGVRDHDITIAKVPGAFEIPPTAKKMALTNGYDAIITLGAVIRGETPHFDYICSQTAHGIAEISLACGIPVIFGVLTANTMEQAVARSNHGSSYAESALEMIGLYERISTGITA